MPPLSKRVRVRQDVSGAEKDVLRSQLGQLGPTWKRVGRKRKTAPPQVEPSRNDEPAPPPPADTDTPPEE